jgi:hypothetical protein
MIDFSDVFHNHVFYLKQPFIDWTLSLLSGRKPTLLVLIDRASPCLQMAGAGSVDLAQMRMLFT